MSLKIRGVRMKLIRAEEHLGTLRAEFASYIESKPYQIVREPDRDPPTLDPPTMVTIRLKQWTAPTARWSVIIGDIVHNLRSAIDHLAWQLVKANNGTPRTEQPRTQFPILLDRLTERGNVRAIEIAGGISPAATALVEALQPYNRVDDPTMHPLAILNELSNRDKHRQLNFFMPWIAVAETVTTTGLEALLGMPPQIHPGPFFNNSVVAEFPYPLGMNVDVKVSPLVTLPITWEGDQSGQMVDLLAYLVEFVREVVIEPFARAPL